jgi:hypothetical protein
VGVEITADVAYGPRSVITRQVENGVFIRMAVLRWALARATKRAEPAVAARSAVAQYPVPAAG